jgi:hypothetical protein
MGRRHLRLPSKLSHIEGAMVFHQLSEIGPMRLWTMLQRMRGESDLPLQMKISGCLRGRGGSMESQSGIPEIPNTSDGLVSWVSSTQ